MPIALASATALLLNPLIAVEPAIPAPQLPVIPSRSFSVTQFGAVGDGTRLNTAAFRAAIEACAKSGGGHVVVPEGIFVTGPIELKSATDLHLAKGATLKMSPNSDDFPITGRDRQGFISVTDAHDVQISGEGTIDGQGEPWWVAFRQTKGTDAAKSEPRRPQMVILARCERVKLAGIKTMNPPNTHCSLRQCKEVTIDGLTMVAPADSPNTDALNLNIRNAVIRNCHIETGDDNIVFLAGASAKEKTPGVENVVVSNCTLGVGHGLSIGSFTSGGIRNIVVDNVIFDGTTAGIRMKADRGRGGLVENITFKNVTMKNVKNPIYLTSYYPSTPKRPDEDKGEPVGATTPEWRNITIENGTLTDCLNSVIIWGLPERPMLGIKLRNLNITAERGAVVYHARDIRFDHVQMRAAKGAALTTFDAQVEGITATPLGALPEQP